ncbi:beta-N-acetylhexosaminidase [Solemya pervernicosa gill symbiont]|uniref:Beta-hexosaminidase n=2 Tax=Gammaproteobacteria incertae sedis TaxID=118884 RepID=A0A1T2LAB7_9GAMM|nr:beta-N-acetylhexosaminidase [Candidatus Reidiella endopervernicosa]OOZ42045.1 beta-N-acetylhexosaminidase [Solemya pervernicosa gill symbiont]QKQ27006.1 beta-N-acetylhexosaminidase [Candidatus Reidiella endopervernicosa]
MTLGPLMVDLEGTTMESEERQMLCNPLVGGVILFSRNYESPEQIAALCSEIHELRTPHLLIGVDHEGGPVQRFREGFTRLPSVSRLGDIYDINHKKGLTLAETSGWLMASELRAVGIDFSFAPVLDLGRGISSVMKGRTFHKDPEVVAQLAHAYLAGMQRAGMAATGKHFPGHGSIEADSHVAMPVDERRYEDIFAEDVLPFERMIHYGLAAIMPAHVIYSQVDSQPAGFSAFWLQEVLRKRLEFSGVIFSDDLSMAAAESAGSYSDRARAALQAGCDVALVCNNRAAAEEVLSGLGEGFIDDPVSQLRRVRMHGRHPVTRAELHQNPKWVRAVHSVTDYDESPEIDLPI